MTKRSLAPQLPVIIVTGFLGSGKTTLVNRLLRDQPRSAVVLNEFGATPVDQALLAHHGAPMAVLSGGCLCCQVRGALAPLLKNLWMAWRERSPQPFDRMLIETSGVASPGPVLDTLLRDTWLVKRTRLLGVITTVAAPLGADYLGRFPEAEVQVAFADTLVITQADLSSAGDLERLVSRLDRLAPTTRRLTAHPSELAFDAVLPSAAGFSALRSGPTPEAGHGFRSVSVRLDGPVFWEPLRLSLESLLIRHRERLIRVKGVVYTPALPTPLVVQGGAGRLHPPVPLSGQADQDGQGRLVFITAGPVEDLANELIAAIGPGGAALSG